MHGAKQKNFYNEENFQKQLSKCAILWYFRQYWPPKAAEKILPWGTLLLVLDPFRGGGALDPSGGGHQVPVPPLRYATGRHKFENFFWLKNIIADFAFWGGGIFYCRKRFFRTKEKVENFQIFSKVSVVEVEARQLKGEARAGGFLRGAGEPPLGFRIF